MAQNEPKSNTNPSGYCVDTLTALVERGPLDDGDVPSKSGRNGLIASDHAVRVVVKGEDGFTGATPLGKDLYLKHWGGSNTVKEAIAYQATRHALRRLSREK